MPAKSNNALMIQIITLVVAAFAIGGFFYILHQFNVESARANIAQEKLNNITGIVNERYKSDSVNMVKQFNIELSKRDSSLAYANGQLSKIIPINKYYDAKIRYTQTAAVTVIDKQFDSLRSELYRRYNK